MVPFQGGNRHNSTTFIKPELDQIEKELALLSEQIKESEGAVAAVQADLKAKKAVQADTKLAGEEARLAEQKHNWPISSWQKSWLTQKSC